MTMRTQLPPIQNEPVLQYAPGSAERAGLKGHLDCMLAGQPEFPLVIGGEQVVTGEMGDCTCPHAHGHRLARFHQAGPQHVQQAIDAATRAAPMWAAMALDDRIAIFLKAAELLATKYRYALNAATMLGQGKTAYQAEIDSACELIDFWRFNCLFAAQIAQMQPQSSPGMWNMVDYRPLEGFVYAITPFNFTAIAGNLPTAPALMGNTVVWKPAASAMYSANLIMQILQEAGLPPGVINFVPGPAEMVSRIALCDTHLAGVHFTGSTSVFNAIWRTVAENLPNYRSYPRIVGETGGKDFIFVHPSASVDAVVTAAVRGAYEYQGQKCSAASRMYVPQSLLVAIRDKLVDQIQSIKMGPPTDFRNFVGAVIDRRAFDNIKGYIDDAKQSNDAQILAGGDCNNTVGYFIRPTLIQTTNPKYRSMCEEIFGPVLTMYAYPDAALDDTMALCAQTSPYGLTGAIFATDRRAIEQASATLRHAAGNFYINDKPTGAVVGQQPFGGGRASGTNDKAGSILNLLRWVSPRTIKETFVPPTTYGYPFMDAE